MVEDVDDMMRTIDDAIDESDTEGGSDLYLDNVGGQNRTKTTGGTEH